MGSHADNLARLRKHPVILAEAERMAKRYHDAYWQWQDVVPPKLNGKYRRHAILAHADLLLSLDAASRDALVRLGIANDGRWRVCRGSIGYGVRGPGDIWAPCDTKAEADQRCRATLQHLWHALRDNPEALVAALVEVLDA